jgi:hypothetical protein
VVRWLACLLAVALAACATEDGRSLEAKAAAWEAGNVFPASYKPEILAYLRTYLNDPTGVREAQASEPALRNVGPGNRYVVCVRYNPRKAGGAGYAGSRESAATFVGGKLDRFVDLRGEQAKSELCAGAAYAAFPELERLTR